MQMKNIKFYPDVIKRPVDNLIFCNIYDNEYFTDFKPEEKHESKGGKYYIRTDNEMIWEVVN